MADKKDMPTHQPPILHPSVSPNVVETVVVNATSETCENGSLVLQNMLEIWDLHPGKTKMTMNTTI